MMANRTSISRTSTRETRSLPGLTACSSFAGGPTATAHWRADAIQTVAVPRPWVASICKWFVLECRTRVDMVHPIGEEVADDRGDKVHIV